MAEDKSHLAKTALHGVYIPVALILGGITILNWDYLPHTIAILVVFFSSHLLYAKFTGKKILTVNEFQKYELIDKTVVSKNSAIYRFKLFRENDTLQIPVGQHLACRIQIEGVDEIRYYTPISNQYDEGFFDILVKSYKDGRVSKYFATLYTGQKVEFRGPVGRISYTPNMAKEITMIAGGSGITPMLQVIGAIVTTPEDLTKVRLIYANETENDILLKEELDEFSEKYPNFKVDYVLNKPERPKLWNGYTGYITKELLSELLPKPTDDNKVFICGPMPMKKLMLQYCEELGYEKGVLSSKQDDQLFCF
ncbi:hypothetical protein CANARDRAFT_29293 [[Candida] arabinofermentans NRRL YB-2248]|uniref:NADH-cytochrome b5 reductase n=1 Tax=[Candida] arabinofermentans NRRL YB-2248 TaxID=983967 RepID=A0A1E4SX99_9ASCO|nr:hypothetical protein CANARDRAFT_29293 [[Candida] arabinofermentans NRRL YB-2248]